MSVRFSECFLKYLNEYQRDAFRYMETREQFLSIVMIKIQSAGENNI